MSFDVYLPFVASVVFAVLGVGIARRLRPAHATWLLTCGAIVTSACTMYSLLLLAWALLARFSAVASLGDWSAASFRQHNPVGVGVSVAAIAVLVIVCARTSRALVRHVRDLATSYRACRCLPASVGELVVVDDDGFHARALPGRPGRVMLSKAAVTTLSAAERTAVLAHERSHLLHRHHLHRLAVALAAAANPLLRTVPRATSLAVERWADEDAAHVCPPETVAAALCRAVAARAAARRAATAVEKVGSLRVTSPWQRRTDLARRVSALCRRSSRRGWLVFPVAVASLIALIFTSAEATSDANQLAHRSDVPGFSSEIPASPVMIVRFSTETRW